MINKLVILVLLPLRAARAFYRGLTGHDHITGEKKS